MRETPVRTALRPLGRALLTGALPGALGYAGLFALSLTVHRSAEYMGVEDETLTDSLVALFEDELTAQQLGFLGTYLVVGALAGLAAWGWLELVQRVREPAERRWRPWIRVGATLILAFAIHAWFLTRSAATYPALYAPQVGASWLLAAVFTLGVDVLPAAALDLLGWAFAASALGMAGWLLRHRARRAFEAVRQGQRRPLLVAGVVGGAVLALALQLGAASSLGPARASEPRRPNVLIIAVDSLRGDLVAGAQGVTPSIDAFAARGTRFSAAYTVMPRTFPAWASILTGQYPHHHGIRHMFPGPDDGVDVPGSLARVLGAAGYRTGVITDSAGEVFSRRDFGFEHTDAPAFTLRSNVELGGAKVHVHLMPYLVDVLQGATAPELHANERLGDPRWVTDRALRWLGAGDDRPFFLTLFYSAGHFPFASPAPWYRRFADPAYRGRSRFHKETFGTPLEGEAAQAEREQIRGLYLGALAASDAAIGELLTALDAHGVLDETLVVITADHGENVYEHGLGVGHGDHLYGLTTLHVPIVMAWPEMEGRRLVVDEPVRTIDIAPTLLARLGLEPAAPPDGVDLTPRILGQAAGPALPVFAETGLWFYPPETRRLEGRRLHFARGLGDLLRPTPGSWEIHLAPHLADTVLMAKHRMVLADGRKLLYMPTRDGVVWELYDPWADPAEARELSEVEPARLEALKARLYAWMEQDPAMVRAGDFVLPRRALGGAPR